MKKNIFSFSAFVALIFVLTAMVFTSCEKAIFSDEEASTKGEPNGNLVVRVFEIEKTQFASLTRGDALNAQGGSATTRASKAASEVLTRLNFAVYDEGGSRVKQVNQTSDMANFGTASFQLDEGQYSVVVVGHSANGNPTMTNASKIQFTNTTGYTDTFLSCDDYEIGEEPLELDVELERIVARCSFVITDEFPSEVKKMQFYYTGGSGAFSAYTGLGTVNSKQTVTFDVNAPSATIAPTATSPGGKQFDLYTFLHEESDNIALKVSGLDANGNVLYERDFDVPMQQNHITWLTGAYFTGSGSSSTTVTGVTVNTNWAGETHLTF